MSEFLDIQQNIEEWIEWLANQSDDTEGGVTRLLYTESWLTSQKALEQRMNDMGLNTYYDDVGNLFGRLSSNDPHASGVILTGSHVDTVKCGGKYDGAYGILAGLLALRFLKGKFGPPRRHLEVVSLCEEEGSRFPLAFWGSTNVTGTAQTHLAQVQNYEGISLIEAMQDTGFGKGKYVSPRREDILSFVELHIEQGAILEHEQIPIGIVEQIVGQKRFTVECVGEANHAGTTPMKWRKDALRGASQMIERIMAAADRTGAPLVATVGKIEVEPNILNVIPGKAAFTLDIRHPQADVLDMFCEEVEGLCVMIAEERGLQFKMNKHLDARPVEMDKRLIHNVEKICRNDGLPFMFMPSGAGHDAQVMATHYPTCLVFVPSHRGISHNPKEFTSKEDLAAGVQVLIKLLYQLAYEESSEE